MDFLCPEVVVNSTIFESTCWGPERFWMIQTHIGMKNGGFNALQTSYQQTWWLFFVGLPGCLVIIQNHHMIEALVFLKLIGSLEISKLATPREIRPMTSFSFPTQCIFVSPIRLELYLKMMSVFFLQNRFLSLFWVKG